MYTDLIYNNSIVTVSATACKLNTFDIVPTGVIAYGGLMVKFD